ncbi:HHL014Wp [Eremothecium sinecaudum]|uniref:Geranylgeranyl transferase type-2 subunit alpha n=1 Tax=Eremothecium sinecaudum TaxID=45286 RepID=A0A120K2W0_9SACH|nr:HHL014Wp [Eremothecium sinecaudum]AMD22756.1 HHL014Wp [Eremothecium sinecaudum]
MHGIKRRQWTDESLAQKRALDQEKIKHYRNLNNKLLAKKTAKKYDDASLVDTTRLLSLNPEFNSIWNYRRDIISAIKDTLDENFWERELEFTMDQLRSFPKVYWIWNHRVWCLNNYPGSSIEVWKRELVIVGKLLEMDPRNFHGWHYRRIIIASIEKISDSSMNKHELEYTTTMINGNISNFSAWHQRCQLIPKMIKMHELGDLNEFIQKEINYLINAMFTDAEDQSVWMYVKWFIKEKCIIEHLTTDAYIAMLQKFKENILYINEDELEFSGKENVWCLKALIVIESIETSDLNLTSDCKKEDYLNRLIELDQPRKNRYRHMLNDA